MEYIPRGELFAAWRHLDSFGETLVKIYIAELAMVLGMYNCWWHVFYNSLLIDNWLFYINTRSFCNMEFMFVCFHKRQERTVKPCLLSHVSQWNIEKSIVRP